MQKLVRDLMESGYLRSDLIIGAFAKINRADFVPQKMESEAYENVALPIGYGQTISQPLTVAFMLELLEPRFGQIILDVGSGSGWTTALLSEIVGDKGRVIALERIKELADFGRKNVEKYGFIKRKIAEIHLADGKTGFPDGAPYDRILVSASSLDIPGELRRQMKIGGKMVIPIRNSIVYLERRGEDEFFEKEFPGFSFVPFITQE